MAKTKCKKQTFHGMMRARERGNMPSRVAKDFISSASKRGFSFNDLPEGELKDYVFGKFIYRQKRVKIYKGYIFIFNRTSNRLITMYPIPDNLVEEFNSFAATRKYPN